MEHSLPGCHQKVGNDYYKYKSIYNYVVQPTKNLMVYIAVYIDGLQKPPKRTKPSEQVWLED